MVETVANKGITEDFLVSRMVGRSLSLTFPPKQTKFGPVRLKVTGLASPGWLSDVSFAVSSGEIVGLGGIQGNGQREIVRALFELLPKRIHVGARRLGGRCAHRKRRSTSRKPICALLDRRGRGWG